MYHKAQYLVFIVFYIYMNDIPNVSDVFKFILFADDTGLFSTIEYSIPTHLSNVNEMLNHELALKYKRGFFEL